jgi:hypothetical protein
MGGARRSVAAPRRTGAWLGLLALACLALLAGACGDDERKPPAGALQGALSLIPADAGLAVSVSTDQGSGTPLRRLDRLGSRLSRWKAIERRIRSALSGAGLEIDGLLRGQLGNPLVLGSNERGRAVLAIRVRDGRALRAAVERRIDAGSVDEADTQGDAFGWRDSPRVRDGFGYFALLGDDLVATQSRDDIADALDAAGEGRNLAANEAAVRSLAKLGGATLARLWGDARRLLSSEDAGQAIGIRRVAWIRALGALDGAVRVGRAALRIELRVRSDRAPLEPRDLPIAPGATPPRVHDPGAATIIGVRRPDQGLRFLEPVLGAVDPERFGRYRAGVTALNSLLGIDLHRDLLARVANLSIAASSPRKFEFVATLERGAGERFTLSLDAARPFIAGVVQEFLPRVTIDTEDFGAAPTWVVKSAGLPVARYGVRGDALVGSTGIGGLPAPRRGRLARTEGALSVEANPVRIASLLGPLGALFGRAVLGEAIGLLSGLGDLTLGVRAETRELRASGRIVPGGR